MLDVYPSCSKGLEAASGLRVRVERGRDDPAHPGGEHGLGAGRRRAVVRARLHASGRASSPQPALPQPRARAPRRAARLFVGASPRRRPRRPGRRPPRPGGSDASSRVPSLRAPVPARDARSRASGRALVGLGDVVAPERARPGDEEPRPGVAKQPDVVAADPAVDLDRLLRGQEAAQALDPRRAPRA